MKAAGMLPVRKPEARVIADMRRVAASVRRIDGVDWYDGQIVCRALGMEPDKAYPRVQRARKRYIIVSHGRYRQAKHLLIDRRGVEDLVIARGGLCRSRVMDELDAQRSARAQL